VKTEAAEKGAISQLRKISLDIDICMLKTQQNR